MGQYRTAGLATYHETPARNRHRRNVSRRILDFRYLEYCLGQATVWSSVDRRVLPSLYGQIFPACNVDVGWRSLLGVCDFFADVDGILDSNLLEVEVENPGRRAGADDQRFRRHLANRTSL